MSLLPNTIFFRCSSFDEIFREADVVSLHTNLSTKRRNLVNADSLDRMKDGVIIINCARGELVDSIAMVNALENGKVGGYGTDVLDEEPPLDHPLLKAPRALVTPHIGSRTYESVELLTMAAENLVLCLKWKNSSCTS